jgi:glycosyltransferase involved in cell wall biosynthesis
MGTYFWLTARTLARRGWNVHVLFCGPMELPGNLREMKAELRELGISFWDFERLVPRDPLEGNDHWSAMSSRVYRALEQLHRKFHYDLIEFPEMNAPGFRSVQAKRAGVSFHGAALVVRMHSPSTWHREGCRVLKARTDEIACDYYEQYCFRYADYPIAQSRYILDLFAQRGWAPRFPPLTMACPHPDVEYQSAPQQIREVVFFGRLETRKGLENFVEAARDLDPRLGITFLGREGMLESGEEPSAYIRRRLSDRPVRLIRSADRATALRYLAEGHRLAVIASHSETYGYTFVECTVNRIPVVVARYGALAEILPDRALWEEVSSPHDAKALRAAIERAAARSPEEQRALAERLFAATDPAVVEQRVADGYEELLRRYRATPKAPSTHKASVVVVHRDATHTASGPGLSETLTALAQQDYANMEILVVDDGSAGTIALEDMQRLEARFPKARFVHQQRANGSAAGRSETGKNRALREAVGDVVITVGAGDVPLPHMVGSFVRAMEANPELAGLTCFTKAKGRPHCPEGGPRILSFMYNNLGGATVAYRRSSLEELGGFPEGLDAEHAEGWAFLVQILMAGHRVDTIPDYLVRHRAMDRQLRADPVARSNALRMHAAGALTPDEQVFLRVLSLDGVPHAYLTPVGLARRVDHQLKIRAPRLRAATIGMLARAYAAKLNLHLELDDMLHETWKSIRRAVP